MNANQYRAAIKRLGLSQAQAAKDPLTFETNVPGLFIAGGQVAGRRTGSVFIENGRFHGEQVARVHAERFSLSAG